MTAAARAKNGYRIGERKSIAVESQRYGLITVLERFEPDIRNSLLHLAPAVPDWIGTLRLDNIPLMGGKLAVEVHGEVVRALEVPDGLSIVSEPRLATR